MFEPIYTISPELLNKVKRIGILTTKLNSHPVSNTVLVKLEKAAGAVSTFSSTSIEGNPLPLTEVKKILRNRPESLRDSEREVINYNRALEFLKTSLKDKSVSFDIDLILKIHSLVTDGLISSPNHGKLRNNPVFVNDPKVGKPVYLPPDQQEVSELMKELIEFVIENQNFLDPVLTAGIFHRQFVIIHPFIDGNGRTVRLLSHCLLASLWIKYFNLFSFENYYNKNVTQYFKKVGLYGDYYELRDRVDFTEWLEYFADGIIDELLRVGKLLDKKAGPEEELKPWHHSILKIIDKKGFITDRDYSKVTERAKSTRAKDFNFLISQGYIIRKGKGKNTHYTLCE